MIKRLFTFCVILISALTSIAQVQEFYVKAHETDAGYSAQDSHFITHNITNHNGKLLLFIGGTYSTPKVYEYMSRFAAELGYDVINIAYPNSVLTTLLAGSTDSLAFDKFRQEICFGTQVSATVTVDSFNSIYTRTLKLLQYLSQLSSYNWSQYLAANDSLDWSKIAVAGHSQGSGHACYFAKLFPVERVVMLAGPNDYSTYFSNAAPWLRQPGITAVEKHFVFLHLRDEIVPFERQYANIGALGMLALYDTVLVENTVGTPEATRCFYTNLAPATSGQFHNSVAILFATPLDGGSLPLFNPIWEFMLTSEIFSGTEAAALHRRQGFSIHPNPSSSFITIEFEQGGIHEFCVMNIFGQMLMSESVVAWKAEIDMSGLRPGIYFIRHGGTAATVVKE